MGLTTKEISSSSFNDMISSVDRRSEYVENRAGANVRLNNFLTPYTLDDKSSILNAPCGYSNGVYPSLRPVQTFGPELVTNGTFDTDSNWIKTNAVIANGKATITVVGGGYSVIRQALFTYVSGRSYVLEAEVQGTSGKACTFFDNGANIGGLGTSNGVINFDGSAQKVYIEWTANTNSDAILCARNGSGDFSFTVDNVSVKEVIDADFDFSRGSAATRVTKDGLIKNVQILSDDLVQNGNFEQIGSELVTNGDFDSDSDWGGVGSNGFSISGGKLNLSDVAYAKNVTQGNVTTVGKIYKVTFEISNYVKGNVRVFLGGNVTTTQSSNGIFTSYVTASANTSVGIQTLDGGGTTLSIDNVSVKEVGQNWTLGTGWSIDQANGKVVGDGSMTASDTVRQYISFTQGNKYRFSFTVLDYVSGSLFIREPFDGTLDVVSSNGNYSFDYVVGVNDYIDFRGNSFVGSFTNISVVEITDDTDLPRIDYTDGEGSLLLEPQSTNLVTYSEQFDDSYWTKARSSIISNQITAPDGTDSADKFFDSTDNNTHLVYRSLSVSTSDEYTFSCFLKKGSLNKGFLAFDSSVNAGVVFDLENGTIESEGASITSSNIKQYSNNWYKCSFTHTPPTTPRLYRIGTYNGGISYVGTGTDFIYIWGAQLEQGSYATSYIPTNGSTVTRLADVCNNSGNSDLINSTEGVLYAEISALANDGTGRRMSISDGSNQNRIVLMYYSTSNVVRVFVVSNWSLVSDMTYTVSDTTQFSKIAFSYKQNDFKLWIDGVQRTTDDSGATPTGLKELAFDDGSGSANFYGNVKCVAVFKEALSDEELAKITSTTQQEAFYGMRDKMLQIDADYYEFDDYTTRLKKLF